MDVYSHFPPLSLSPPAVWCCVYIFVKQRVWIPRSVPSQWSCTCAFLAAVVMGKSLGLQQNAPGYHPIFGAHGKPWAIQTWITIHKKNNENWVFHRDRVSVFPDKYWGPYWGLSKAFHEPSLNQICWTATLWLMKYILYIYIYIYICIYSSNLLWSSSLYDWLYYTFSVSFDIDG